MRTKRPFHPEQVDLDAFAREVRALRKEIDAERGEKDIAHLKKMERWGRGLSAFGFATAWIAPNPVTAICLALGKGARWMIMHHVGHRGYDRVPGIPPRYTSRGFARGRRRYLDWFDWMLPDAWNYEHNILHHGFTNQDKDPDLLERNLAGFRMGTRPWFIRWPIFVFYVLTWKATYYVRNTIAAWSQRHQGLSDAPDRLKAPAGTLLWRCHLPYILLNFGVLPAMYLILGPWAYFSALVNIILAEMLTNLHTFAVIVPNHTGDDLFRFDDRPTSAGDAYVRQIIASVNFRTGSDLNDFSHLWLNYQIEHHIWPDLTMRQYQMVQPKFKALCMKYGIPYVQESVLKRNHKVLEVFFGRAKARRLPEISTARSGVR